MGEGKGRVRLQEELFSAWEKELRALGLEGGPALAGRKKAFREEISAFRSPREGELRRLARKARYAGAVLVGDYHTLPRAQRAAARILTALVREGASPLLFLECFSREDERALKAWNRRRIGLVRLRRETRFDQTWGFPWEGYAELIAKARSLGVPLYPLEEDRSRRGMKRREGAMARQVDRAARSRPGRLPFLLVGDLHLARVGLPSLLARQGRRPFRVFQNLEVLYWKLARERDLRREAWLELEEGTWCLLETHPLWKLQSTFAWLEGGALSEGTGPDPDLSEKALELSGALSRWLRIPLPEDRAPLVFTGDPLSFLDLLEGTSPFPQGSRAFFRELRASRLFLPPGRDLVYLASPTLNSLAEGASRWLRRAQREGRERPGSSPVSSFLEGTLGHALGWVGSLLFNPFRVPPLSPSSPMEIWNFLDGSRKGFRALEERIRKVKRGERPLLARRLGERLGAALFCALEEERLRAESLGKVFLAPPMGPAGSFRLLSDLVRSGKIREGLSDASREPRKRKAPSPSSLTPFHPED